MPRTREVIQYSQEGEKIKEHASIKEAAEEIGVNPLGILHVCQGISKSAGGFRWRYKDDEI